MALSGLCRHLVVGVFLLQCLLSTVHSAELWISTGDSVKKLVREADLGGSGSPVGGLDINVNRGEQYQDIKGFGAALSNSAAWLLWNSPDKETILNDLFGWTGIGISYVRLVMGGSDFNAVSPYSYDDVGSGEDLNQDQFSIAKDYDFVIPILRDILRHNPQVRIMASPWSSPGWMKDTNSLYGGQIKSASQYLQSLAEYFVKFVKAYAAEGITIDTITLQNEPEHQTSGYPSMLMPWDVQRDLIRYLGPRFQQEGISTQIIIWDHNWDATWYPLNILNDPEAKQYIAGTGWHCYGGNRYDPLTVQNAHPDKDLYFTECSGGEWDTHFGSVLGWNVQNLFIGQTRIGARTVLLWNLALDENFGPRVDVNGCTDCRGVVTIPSWGGYTKNVEFYTIGHFSKFVVPGARRIQSSTYEADELESAAFQNPDGTVVVVVANVSWDTPKTFQIVVDGQWFYYENLATRSVITFKK